MQHFQQHPADELLQPVNEIIEASKDPVHFSPRRHLHEEPAKAEEKTLSTVRKHLGKEAHSIPGQESMMWTQHGQANSTAMCWHAIEHAHAKNYFEVE
jgi:hypothetical protein